MEITNDIALGLRVPLEEAEEIKRGSRVVCIQKRVGDIVEARLSDIFDLINAHLKKIGKQGLLPAGIIMTGGSSAIPFIEEIAKKTLEIPSKVASPDFAKIRKIKYMMQAGPSRMVSPLWALMKTETRRAGCSHRALAPAYGMH